MAFIGYEPARLRALRRAVHDLVDEQTAIRSDDPWGREPTVRARNELARIASWTVRIDQILDCVFSSPYQPVGTGTGPNRASPYDPALIGIVRPWDQSWLLTLDPTTTIDTDLTTLASELGTWLQHTDVTNVVDDHDGATALVALFNRVAADTAAAEALMKALGPEGLRPVATQLAGLLATSPSPWAEPTEARTQARKAVFDAFARTVSAAVATGHVDLDQVIDPLIHLDPDAALELVGRLSLPADQLARLALAIWGRVSAEKPPMRASPIPPKGPSTAELLIDLFAHEPAVARVALTEMSDKAYTALLRVGDDKHLGQMLVGATDPTHYSKESSAAIVGRLLSMLDKDSALRSSTLVGYVGVIAGPWLPELVIVEDHSSGYPLVPLDLAGRSAWHVLTWIAANKQGAQSLTIWMTAIGETETARIVGDPKASDQFRHLGDILGGASDVIRLARVRDAQHRLDNRRAVWGDLTSTISNLITAPAILAGPVGLAANLAITWVAQAAVDHVLSDRLGNGIVDAARVEQIRKAMSFEVLTMATIASAMYERLVAEHRLPSDEKTVPPPPRPDGAAAMAMTDSGYMDKLTCWRDALPAAHHDAVLPLMYAVSQQLEGFNRNMALGEHVNGAPSTTATSKTDQTRDGCPQNTPAGS
jgi:hypothetical protein